jgi:hypothetical protein
MFFFFLFCSLVGSLIVAKMKRMMNKTGTGISSIIQSLVARVSGALVLCMGLFVPVVASKRPKLLPTECALYWNGSDLNKYINQFMVTNEVAEAVRWKNLLDMSEVVRPFGCFNRGDFAKMQYLP